MRIGLLRLAAFLCAASGFCVAQVVSPSVPVVTAGQSLQFTADRPVTWSLLPGSAGSIEANGMYHAPASVAAAKSLAGCQIGPPDSVFNTRIDSLPTHANNSVWMAALPAQGITLDPSWGINIVDNSVAQQLFDFYYTPGYNSQPFQMPVWPNIKRENGVFSDPLANNDRHVMTVNKQTCQIYELYNNYPAGTQGSAPPASLYTAQSGWQYNSVSYALPVSGSTSASGVPLLPLTLNLDDIRSGAVRHALMVTFANGYISPAFLWPATTNAGAFGTVPYGTRLRLKASFNLSGFSPVAKVILTALKDYGMFITDGGSNWDIITSTDVTEDRAVQSAILEIQNSNGVLNNTQFEIVDESSLMVSPGSAQVAYNNPYVTPSQYAIVQASDGKDRPVTVPIALRGVAMNGPDGGGIWIQAGVSKPLSVFVGGTANTAVTWSMNPALGALDPTGVYTAPTVSAPESTTITAVSAANPAVSVTFPLTVLPPGPIRIAAGDATLNPSAPNSHAPDYGPDSQGEMWWRDQAAERGWGVKNDYWYPASNWPAITDIARFETQYYNIGDTVYRFAVANGNYQIDYYVAAGGCPSSGTYDPLAYREHLESQGQIAVHDFHPLATVAGSCYTPIHATIPALVTDNTLYFALRRITDHTLSGSDQTPVTILGSFSITPVTYAPHLTIDPANPPALTFSQSLQLYAVGWYMSNNVNWALVSGPGAVSANGVYTAPATPLNGTAVVRATSTVDPSQSATLNINLSFGSMTVVPGPVTLNRSTVQPFSAMIGGVNYTNVAWSLSPAIGFIDNTGKYTAPDTLTANTSVTVTATSRDDQTQSASATVQIAAQPAVVRVNCSDIGGFTDARGNVWATDYGYTSSLSYNVNGVPIARTTPDLYPLYDSSRYVYSDQSFQYNFPLPNGLYLVTLKFADYTYSGPGNYDFDVQINGFTVLRNFDPDAVYGTSKTAVDESFLLYNSQKNINLTFLGHQGGAFVNGIEIQPTVAFSKKVSGTTSTSGHAQ